jgi:hypothetical protein
VTLSPVDAARHIGQSVTVCGVLAGTKFDAPMRAIGRWLSAVVERPDHLLAYVRVM